MKPGWKCSKLGDLLQRTETIDPTKKPIEEFLYIDVSSVDNQRFEIMTAQNILGKNAPSRARKLILSNDIIFATVRPTLKRIAIVPEKFDKQICSTGFVVLRPKPIILSRYLYYFLQSDKFISKMQEVQNGTSYPAVTDTQVKEQNVVYPPLADQQRIVAFLDQALSAIDTVKANTEKSLLQVHQVFQTFLQNIFNNPGLGWEEKRISEISTIKGGKRVPKGYRLKTNFTGHPYIRVTDFTDSGTIELSDIHYIDNDVFEIIKNYTISTNDLYISIAGTIGKTGIVPPELNNANLTENACKLVFIKNIDPKFVYFFTKTQNFIDQAGLNTRTTAMPKLALTRLATIKLFIPPSISDQKEVVEKAETLNSETIRVEEIYKQKLKLLSDLKQSILHKAFSGEL